jgi:hypothetical protein
VSRFLVGLVAAVVLAVVPASAFGQDSEVSVGSPSSPFPQNKQNEPDVAIDAANPMVVAAGANDEIDLAPCDGSSCPFTQGVGVSGFYLSFDGGVTWRQPDYTGYSARDGSPGTGPIGTLPNYAEVGLVSNGDPALAFGPRRGANGRFSYENGTRLYYANIATNFSAVRSEAGIRGQGAIAVSHTDSPQVAVDGVNSAWSGPVLASQRQSTTTFADKEDLTADNAATSSYFGNVYVCFTQFRSNGGTAQPIQVASSRDGGESFGLQRQITASAGNARQFGRQGCSMKTDSHGVLYVFFEGAEDKVPSQMLARSFDGGRSFERPRAISTVTDCGGLDVVGRGDLTLDGQAGARNSSFPLADVANGAPSGTGAPNTIAAGWCDGRAGLNHEHARVVVSANGGGTFAASNLEEPGDRPGYVSLALAPDGTDLYLTYDAFLDPFRQTTAPARRMQGVVRHAELAGAATSNAATLHRGMVGDARGSSANSLTNEFLGDYTGVAATDDGAVALWNDVREATVCAAINVYRQSLIDGNPIATPAPNTACLPGFGNSDIFGIAVPDPTP